MDDKVIRSTDPKGVVTAFDYDGQGRAIQVIQNFLSPLARTNDQNVPTAYTFDSRGNRLTITDAMTHTTTLGYDLLGRPTTETDALSHTWTTVYNKLGQRVSMTDAKGQTVSFTYDGVGRLTLIDYPAGTADVTFTYDALGNQVGMADGTGSTNWAYDLTARPITITAPVVGAVSYTYDRLGNRTGLNAPGAKNTTYVYDALSRMTQAAGWASQTATYGYGAFGQVVTATLPNGVTTSYGYDAAQRQTSIAHTYSSQTLATYTYTLDANGNRTRTVELVQGLTQGSSQSLPDFGSVRSGAVSTSGSRTGISGLSGGAAHGWLARWPAATSALTTTIDYGYDNLARLTSAAYSDGTSFGYTYDGVGNRLTQTACLGSGCAPATTTYTYDNANRLATVNGVTYTYDANGNLTADGARTYAYDAADRLTSLTQSGNTSTYAYNGQGDRVSQTVAGVTTRYTLDLASLYTQVLADGSTSYLYGLGRIGEQQTGGWAYHLTDALGSVRQLTTSAGAVSLARRFDPYGAPLTTAGSGSSIYGFTGEQTDPSGNVFLRARYYVPGMGRFLTRDTWVGNYTRPLTLNRWAYVNGNPINLTDPTGHFDPISLTLVGGAVITISALQLALFAITVIAAIWITMEMVNPGCTGRIVSDIGERVGEAIAPPQVNAPAPDSTINVPTVPRSSGPSRGGSGGGGSGGPGIGSRVARILLAISVAITGAGAIGESGPIHLGGDVTTKTKNRFTKAVLVVGDGDFTYSCGLARIHPDWLVVGTDVSQFVRAPACNGGDNLKLLSNIDARSLRSVFPAGAFDTVVFNSPKAPDMKPVSTQDLILGVLESASQVLRAPGGQMRFSLGTNYQGADRLSLFSANEPLPGYATFEARPYNDDVEYFVPEYTPRSLFGDVITPRGDSLWLWYIFTR